MHFKSIIDTIMVYFKSNVKKRKSPSMLKWAIYAIVLIAALFFFIPKMLVNRAFDIIDKEIPEGKTTADSVPKKTIFTAYNLLQVAKFFPTSEKRALEGQKMILDFYFPLFKADYDKLKFACVDNAISFLKAEGKTPADSINIKALQTEWRRHPDEEALEDFRSKWETYHKFFAHSLLPEYPRFIDAQHL
ncbi:MAG: hypothetical protein J6T96_07290 [Bacteroidales bacterium]|nr:hypothetical protein [Bacteroidales bacterium]